MSDEQLKAELTAKVQTFIDKKYVAISDARQKEMGLSYITAERQDLAKEITNFVMQLAKEC